MSLNHIHLNQYEHNRPLTLKELEENTQKDRADWLGGAHPCPFRSEVHDDDRDWCFCDKDGRHECAMDV